MNLLETERPIHNDFALKVRLANLCGFLVFLFVAVVATVTAVSAFGE